MEYNPNKYFSRICELASLKLMHATEQDIDIKKLKKLEMQFNDDSAQMLELGEFVPLEYLFQASSCNSLHKHFILLALARELDSTIAHKIRDLNKAMGVDNFGITDAIAPELAARAMGSVVPNDFFFDTDSPIYRIFFRKLTDDAPWSMAPLRLNSRVLSFIMGQIEPTNDVKQFVTIEKPKTDHPPLAPWQPNILKTLGDGKNFVSLYGEEGAGRKFSARHATYALGTMPCFIKAKSLRKAIWEDRSIINAIIRECLIFMATPIIEISADNEDWEIASKLASVLFEYFDLVFTVSETFPPDLEEIGEALHTPIRLPNMSLTEKRAVWKQVSKFYRFEDGVFPEDMANVFGLTYGQIKRALAGASRAATQNGKDSIDALSLRHGCRELFERNDPGKATRVPGVFDWDDLVLPSAQKSVLMTVCNQVRNKHLIYETWGFDRKMPYGRGISMIFSGSHGTGKTMAAQIVASELGIDLYRIELSAVVSKFVGETEKNLDEIFRRGERSRVALLFDEADVLFSKRTEVKDSNDKYSNMEAAFLLQKMESYDGMTILATNMIQNFDEAFKRRVKFIIDFPFPTAEQRIELWSKAFPDNAPMSDFDIAFLSERFELSGSNIRNISIHAAFLAAEESGIIGMTEILRGVRNEYLKSGKILTKQDVGEYFMLLPELT